MHIVVSERPGGVNSLPVSRFALPIGGLCELYHRTGKDPEELLKFIAGDDENQEDDDEDILKGMRDIAEVEEVIKTILQVSFSWAGNSHSFEREVGIFFDLGRGYQLLSLAGKVLTASASSPTNDGFPLRKESEIEKGPPEPFKISAFYQVAGSLGIDPAAVMRMSLWEFSHYSYGKRVANGEETARMGDAEADEVSRMLDEFEQQGAEDANGYREINIPPRG